LGPNPQPPIPIPNPQSPIPNFLIDEKIIIIKKINILIYI